MTDFLDEARIYVKSGDGGHGMISFRREKYVSHGGPDGGDGGKGGDVVFVANPQINTLRNFSRQVHFRADNGRKGAGGNKTGRSAEDLVIEVPVGTMVRTERGELIADLVREGQRVVIVKGGRGGRGNYHFKSSTRQAPHVAEKGEPGEERWVNLELKLMADVGIVGVPNAGKSTLLSVISNAKPKIANYPFTTLVPNLGLVRLDYKDMVVADIPGIVEGAHLGVGLGIDFLKHVQRTRIIIHLIDASGENPIADFHQINTELALFDPKLLERPTLVVINKLDLPEAQAKLPELEAELRALGHESMHISAATNEGVKDMLYKAYALLESAPEIIYEPTKDISRREGEMAVYTLEEDEMQFQVHKLDDNVYLVTGKAIERAAQMTYWDHSDAIMRFQRILEATGISDALIKAGVRVGDTVQIGDMELEWTD